jgi:UDP-N-acetylmuramate--alanine ligase
MAPDKSISGHRKTTGSCDDQNIEISNSPVLGEASRKSVYFIGIGGIGMSALARWFLALNKLEGRAPKRAVFGSDLTESAITRKLVKEGVKVKIGHKKGHISPQIGLVIYNRAIKPDNQELAAARRLKIPTFPYSAVLGKITGDYTTIAITGSHGKSTTTALAGLTLIKSGLDPTVLVGTTLKEFGGKNARFGRSKYLVIEADDFGAAFLDYSPTLSIVTNIDKEHLDFYKNFTNIKNAFLKFIARTKNGGALILNRDDKLLCSLKLKINKIAKICGLKIVWYSIKNPEAKKVKKIIKISGEHNLSNAVAVYALGRLLKIPEKKILSAIGAYRGSWRRMEYRGEIKDKRLKIKVFDDYAHHPTEIKATLKAFKEEFPNKKIICVFQPHQTERLRLLFREFITAFNQADVLVLLPIYKVAGRDPSMGSGQVKFAPRFTSQKLAKAVKKKYPQKPVFYLANPKNIKKFIVKVLRRSALSPRSSALMVMMGAGDIVNYTNKLIDRKSSVHSIEQDL